MNNNTQKWFYILAGTRKYVRITIYRKGIKLGYLTEDGYITCQIDEAGLFDIKGDMADEAKAMQLLFKRYPLLEIDSRASGKIVGDWDY